MPAPSTATLTGLKRSPRFVERYLLALLALATSVALSVPYYWTSDGLLGLLKNVAPNIIATLLLFAAVYFLLERWGIIVSTGSMQFEVPAPVERHDVIDWGEIIKSAKTLDLVVFYYGTWVRNHHAQFVEFFRKRGVLRLVLSDPENLELMNSVQRYFFPKIEVEELRNRIRDTVCALKDAADESESPTARAQILYSPELLHYSFVLADGRQLYLSVYEQFRRPVVQSSVFKLDLSSDADLETYWEGTLNKFSEGSRVEQVLPKDLRHPSAS